MPLSVEMPAPVNGTRRARHPSSRAVGGCGLQVGRDHICFSHPVFLPAITRRSPMRICPHHAARARPRPLARLLLQQARPERGAPARATSRAATRWSSWRRRRTNAGRGGKRKAASAAHRAHLQLGQRRNTARGAFRPPRLRGRQHLRHLRAADGRRRHHQPAAARRPMAFVRSPDNISIELCRRAMRCRPRSRGPRCRTPASGEGRARLRCARGLLAAAGAIPISRGASAPFV